MVTQTLSRGNTGNEPIADFSYRTAGSYLGPFTPREPGWAAWAREHGLYGLDAAQMLQKTLYGGRTADEVIRDHRDRYVRVWNRALRRLSDEQVLELRTLYSTGRYSQSELGARYGVAQHTVSVIVRGLTYRDVEMAAD